MKGAHVHETVSKYDFLKRFHVIVYAVALGLPRVELYFDEGRVLYDAKGSFQTQRALKKTVDAYFS